MSDTISFPINDKKRPVIAGRSHAFWASGFLIVMAMLLGGGGSRTALFEMLVQLAAIPALVVGLGNMRTAENWPAFRGLVMLLGAAVVLVIAQLIPLPPALWQALPGRELLAEASGLLYESQPWRPWSIDPELTLQAGLSLVVPLGVVLTAMHLDMQERRLLLMLVLMMVIVNLGTSFLQAISGGSSFYLYQTSHKGLPIGLFANRNHMAQLLLIAIFVAAGLFATRRSGNSNPGQIMLLSAVVLVLAFAILATNSRTVTALLLPALIFVAYTLLPKRFRKKALWIIGGIIAAIAALIAAMLSTGRFQAINTLVDRFGQNEDHRFEFWPDAWSAMWQYMPSGSGMGTFDTAFRANETLAIVGTHYVNNAHNEYLEIGIEAGIFGLAIIAGLIFWVVRRAFQLFYRSENKGSSVMAGYAIAALGFIALHSLTDYPLRALSIMAVASLLLSIVAASGRRAGPGSQYQAADTANHSVAAEQG